MSARDDLTLARQHPAAATATLLLALAFGATVGGVWDGGWSAVTALLVVALFAGWIAALLIAARAAHGGVGFLVGRPSVIVAELVDRRTDQPAEESA